MIGYLKGKIVDLQPTKTYIDINGVGYEVQITLSTYEQIHGVKETLLYIYNHIREDQYLLFGFSSIEEKNAFELLISVSGIGAQTGRMILSSMSSSEVFKAIRQGNKKALQTVKGIGLKTAERMILELRDKVPLTEDPLILEENIITHNTIEKDTLKALIGLGIAKPVAEKAIQSALKDKNSDVHTVEALIKIALKKL